MSRQEIINRETVATYRPEEFQHERDSSTASSIFNNRFTAQILNALHNTGLERTYTYLYEASCPQLTEKTAPKLFRSLGRACEMFGLKTRPKVFVTRNYRERVFLRGVNNPLIIFSSEYLKKLDDESLFGVLAGQVAGIRCQHHTIFYITWGLEFASSFIPGGSIAVAPFINEWMRCRYFTYDRAFALATGNRELSLRQVLLNVVPKNILDKMALGTARDAFIKQANNFVNMTDRQENIRSVVSKFSDKDWLPERFVELQKFFDERRH